MCGWSRIWNWKPIKLQRFFLATGFRFWFDLYHSRERSSLVVNRRTFIMNSKSLLDTLKTLGERLVERAFSAMTNLQPCFWRFPLGLIDAIPKVKNEIRKLYRLLLKLLINFKKSDWTLLIAATELKKKQISCVSIGRIECTLLFEVGEQAELESSQETLKSRRKLTFESTKYFNCSKMISWCGPMRLNKSIRGCSNFSKLAHCFLPILERGDFTQLNAWAFSGYWGEPRWWGNKVEGGFRKIGIKQRST